MIESQQISGSRTLHRLIYLSRQRLTLDASLDDAVDDIIRASIANNRAVSITGLLLVHQGWFLQALEGPAAAVLTTYGRIVDDARHEAAQVLSAGPAERREFGEWNMCARRASPSDAAILDTLDQRGPRRTAALDGRNALRLLKAVRNIQDGGARSMAS